ncbi:hypothetical protein KR222_005247 [Zaprionus bogoriensis]|nr:hypothetical protein KR222_005247 [Zaprionus bogoriensis]
MFPRGKFILVAEIMLISAINAAQFAFIPVYENLFTPCPNAPVGVYGAQQAFDFSDLGMEMDIDNSLKVSGNVTTNWNIEKTDRLQTRFELHKFDRNTWIPTTMAMSVYDSCKVLYDKNQHWYVIWTKHVLNVEEIKDNCFNVPGTVFVHEPFEVEMIFNVPGSYNGRHKLLFTIKAFGPNNVLRNTSICAEIIGDIESVN